MYLSKWLKCLGGIWSQYISTLPVYLKNKSNEIKAVFKNGSTVNKTSKCKKFN